MAGPATSSFLAIGSFAQRIACDLASTGDEPMQDRHRRPQRRLRLAWIATAARARAHMFDRPLGIASHKVDLAVTGPARALWPTSARRDRAGGLRPGRRRDPAGGNAWTRLVAEGGLSATAVFQALLTSRIARATADLGLKSQLINCCFPDVANGIVTGMGLPVLCGIGNIAILAHAFAGSLAAACPAPDLKLICHYQNIGAWRRPRGERTGPAARVWLDGREISDMFSRFADVQLTPEPVIDISGASGVTLMLALAAGRDWRGHVPGPAGLPGGYPVALRQGQLALDLPAGLTREDAVAWNARYEAENGLCVASDGRVHYAGRLRERLQAESPALAAGFHVDDLEQVYGEFSQLRDRLLARRA